MTRSNKSSAWFWAGLLIFLGAWFIFSWLRFYAKSNPENSDQKSPIVAEETAEGVSPENDAVGGAIAAAIAKREQEKALFTIEEELGLICSSYILEGEEDCYEFVMRVSRNPELYAAARKAKKQDINIYFFSRKFQVGGGFVVIDATASDEKIIRFLLGG